MRSLSMALPSRCLIPGRTNVSILSECHSCHASGAPKCPKCLSLAPSASPKCLTDDRRSVGSRFRAAGDAWVRLFFGSRYFDEFYKTTFTMEVWGCARTIFAMILETRISGRSPSIASVSLNFQGSPLALRHCWQDWAAGHSRTEARSGTCANSFFI